MKLLDCQRVFEKEATDIVREIPHGATHSGERNDRYEVSMVQHGMSDCYVHPSQSRAQLMTLPFPRLTFPVEKKGCSM
jgi:hypothetical protein